MPVRELRGKNAIITGGGSGIGRAIAEALAAEGCNLALIDSRNDRLDEVAESLAQYSVDVSTHVCDVSDVDAVRAVHAEIVNTWDAVHVLVNSAGVSLAGPFADQTIDDLEWVMRANFMGTVNTCHAFLPELREAKGAQIVNVSSSFGIMGFANKAGYSASKFAVRGFSEALRMELHSENIGVTVLYPGPVATNIIRDGRATGDEQKTAEDSFLKRRGVPPDLVARRTLHAIRRNKPRILIGPDYRLIDLATRLAPGWTQAIAARLAKRLPF